VRRFNYHAETFSVDWPTEPKKRLIRLDTSLLLVMPSNYCFIDFFITAKLKLFFWKDMVVEFNKISFLHSPVFTLNIQTCYWPVSTAGPFLQTLLPFPVCYSIKRWLTSIPPSVNGVVLAKDCIAHLKVLFSYSIICTFSFLTLL